MGRIDSVSCFLGNVNMFRDRFPSFQLENEQFQNGRGDVMCVVEPVGAGATMRHIYQVVSPSIVRIQAWLLSW